MVVTNAPSVSAGEKGGKNRASFTNLLQGTGLTTSYSHSLCHEVPPATPGEAYLTHEGVLYSQSNLGKPDCCQIVLYHAGRQLLLVKEEKLLLVKECHNIKTCSDTGKGQEKWYCWQNPKYRHSPAL